MTMPQLHGRQRNDAPTDSFTATGARRTFSKITHQTNVFDKTFELTTSTTIRPRSATTSKAAARVTDEDKPPTHTNTRRPAATSSGVPAATTSAPLTTSIVDTPDGRQTVVGSVVPMSTRDSSGRPIRSGIANASTTVPIAAAAAAVSGPLSNSASNAANPPTSIPATSAVSSASHRLSPGEIAAAVVVPIVVVLAAVVLGLFCIRRRRRRQASNATTHSDTRFVEDAVRGGSASPDFDEKAPGGAPYITADVLHNYNTGLDSVVTSTANGSDNRGTSAATAPYPRSQQGSGYASNPFTDVSGASSQKGSDMFAGFSGGGTERGSSAQTSKGSTASARGVSPVRESDTRASNRAGEFDDAISDISEDAEFVEAEVAQAHMGRAHRASVITMRGMGGGSNEASPKGSPKGSPLGSPDSTSPIRQA